jgi:hypothetical protein
LKGAGTYAADLPYFFRSLDRGWRVAPTGHQDNHEKDWVTPEVLLSESKIDYLLTQVNTIGFHPIYCFVHRKIETTALCTDQHSY